MKNRPILPDDSDGIVIEVEAQKRLNVGPRGGSKSKRRSRELTFEIILDLADKHHAETGLWPNARTGNVAGTADERWYNIDHSLKYGGRGLSGGYSLSRLLHDTRGARRWAYRSDLEIERIVGWAADHHASTGELPTTNSGTVIGADGVTWAQIDGALQKGLRGLPKGSSLPKLLEQFFAKKNKGNRPRLDTDTILAWADAYSERYGSYPVSTSGPVPYSPGDTWTAIDQALVKGVRGLPGGSSLARLLYSERGHVTKHLGQLSESQILAWAEEHFARFGEWPSTKSGPVASTTWEDWKEINDALRGGNRGLPKGGSLARLFARERGRRNRSDSPKFELDTLATWAQCYYGRHGKWPITESGEIPESAPDTWSTVQTALNKGIRGLEGNPFGSLRKFIENLRGALIHPVWTIERILELADAHQSASGKWPRDDSGPVAGAPGETWGAISAALSIGLRGLPGGSSLSRLLAEHRGVRSYTRR